MVQEHDLEELIIGLVAEWSRRDVNRLCSDTLINSWRNGGLAIDGADADDLIGFISSRLGWPLKDFNYDDYFGPELGWNPISLVAMLIKGERMRSELLTIGQLSRMFFESQPIEK